MGVDTCVAYGFLLYVNGRRDSKIRDDLAGIKKYLTYDSFCMLFGDEDEDGNPIDEEECGDWSIERDAYVDMGKSFHIFLHHYDTTSKGMQKTGGYGGFGMELPETPKITEEIKKEASQIFKLLPEDIVTNNASMCVYQYLS
jgi:hypothetical protein